MGTAVEVRGSQPRAAASLMVPWFIESKRSGKGREGRWMAENLKDSFLARGGKPAWWIWSCRKTTQPRDRDVGVGSCLPGQLGGDQGEKAEDRSSGRM